ncbi:MAG: glycosyltransferase family 2 protein [Candidatus Curtissbacteria bacterium]|nr:glycosyltransferase family 2 protein [Candidatus Curtissbacteria bacterium]
MYKRLSVRQKLNLVNRVLSGESISEVCTQAHVSRTVFYHWLNLYKQSETGNRGRVFESKVAKGNKHWRILPSKTARKIIRLAIKDPSYSIKKIAFETGISYHGVCNVLERSHLNTQFLREQYVSLYGRSLVKVVPTNNKVTIIRRFEAGEKVAKLCREFGISRTVFYRWLKRYREASDDYKYDTLKVLRPVGEKHWRFVPEARELVIEVVSKNPEFSPKYISRELALKVGKQVLGSHGVYNILLREGLNTVEKRRLFAQGYVYAPKAEVAPLYIPEMPMYRLRQLIAPFLTVPRLVSLFTRDQILLVFILFSTFYVYKMLSYIVFSKGGTPIGTFFAVISFTCGIFFFIYSMKYYVSVLMVLKLAQTAGGPSAPAKEVEKKRNRLGSIFAKFASMTSWRSAGAKNPLLVNLNEVHLRSRPFVSIHVALYNEKRVVERLIRACTSQNWLTADSLRQTADSSKRLANYEVVIADDSTDETTEIAKQVLIEGLGYKEVRTFYDDELETFVFTPQTANSEQHTLPSSGQAAVSGEQNAVSILPTVKLIHRFARTGFKGAALQKALENTDSRAEFIAIFDADFVPYADTVEQFVKSFQEVAGGLEKIKESKIAVIQGYQWHVLNKSQNWVTRGVRTEYAGSYVIERSSEELYGGLKQVAGSVYMIRADVLRSFGWGKSITEDFELTLRLYEAGYKVAFTPYIQAPAEAVSTIRRLVRQRMRWAEGASFNIKVMLGRMLKSPNLTRTEKFEFIYLAPYYLQAAFFVIGTFAWFVSEAVLHSHLPFWTAAFGWSLVFTNLFALPLMNIVGLFLEESDERDYAGILAFILISYIVVPFQAYAAIKGFLEPHEGPWFRTPKTGLITDTFGRSGFDKFFGNIFGRPSPAGSQAASQVSLQSVDYRLQANFNLAFASAHNGFRNNFKVRPKKLRWVGKAVLAFTLTFALFLNLVSFNQGFDVFNKGKSGHTDAGRHYVLDGKDNFQSSETPEFTLKGPSFSDAVKETGWLQKILGPTEVQAAEPETIPTLLDYRGQPVREVTPQVIHDGEDLKLAIPDAGKLKPGKYTLDVLVKDGDGQVADQIRQDFTWGVLAINVNKSIYTPGEAAKLAFGVLDDAGNTICNAKLKLTISAKGQEASGWDFSTDDGSIRRSEKCDGNKYSPVPDYTAQFVTGFPGIYQMELSVQTEAGTRQIEDYFEVWESVPFDVERTSFPTRIKTQVEYPVKLTIVANQDFAGEVVETVPSSFNASCQLSVASCRINEEAKQKTINWQVDWRKGEKHELSYTIKFPPPSPQFYLIGPLKIGNFEEARTWQIAADPVATIFMEPGFDATDGAQFYSTLSGSCSQDQSTKHTGRGSMKCTSGSSGAVSYVRTSNGILNDAGTRMTFYVNFGSLPTGNLTFAYVNRLAGSNFPELRIVITSGGALQLWNDAAQIGTNGSTLLAGYWYRLALSYKIVGSGNNEIRLYKDGSVTPNISVSNATLGYTLGGQLILGWFTASVGNSLSVFFDDIYVDDGTDFTDPGDIRVTAKLPASGGGSFGTAIGANPSNRWTNVNERPIYETNGWLHEPKTALYETYGIESASAGDVNISGSTLVARTSWIWAKRGNGAVGTPQIRDNGTNTAITLDTSSALYAKITDSTTYPSGTDVVGMQASGAGADTFLYETGMLFASLGDPIPELALVLAPFSLFAPKIIKSIQKGTLVEDTKNLLRKIFESASVLFYRMIAGAKQLLGTLARKRKKGRGELEDDS